jgi:hypothetical protein
MITQIAILAISIIELLIFANMHGKPRAKYNFWIKLIDTMLFLSLLYFGGFFNCFFN